MNTQLKTAIIDNRPFVVQALAEQFRVAHDIEIVATGQTGESIIDIAQNCDPNILIIAADIPQNNHNTMRFQLIHILRIIKYQYSKIKVILMVSKHIPILAYLATQDLDVAGYIVMQDARITRMPDVVRQIAAGRKIHSDIIKTDPAYLEMRNGLTDTQITILCALVTNPDQKLKQVADGIGLSYGSIRVIMSTIFKVCGTCSITGTLMETNAWDIRQFQLTS